MNDQPLTVEEAVRLAELEGLTLLKAATNTGYRGVFRKSGSRTGCR